MEIKSSAFAYNDKIPTKYTCDGQDINPPLQINGVPENTQSLALIMDDPDAPNGIFTHWTIWNIDAATTEIAEDNVPQNSVQGKTSFGSIGYGGPCPHNGEHRYFFRIFALDSELDLSEGADVEDVRKQVEERTIAQAEYMGVYER